MPLIWEGTPDEDPEPLYGTAGAFNYGGYRSSALEALIDEAQGRRRAGRARADPGPNRAPALRRAAGDLPLSLRRSGAGLDARPRAGRRRRQVRPPARLARPMTLDRRRAGVGLRARSGVRPQACLPQKPTAGAGVVDPFRAPDPQATELNAAAKDSLSPGQMGRGADGVPRGRGRRSQRSWRRGSTSPARSCARSGSARR